MYKGFKGFKKVFKMIELRIKIEYKYKLISVILKHAK